MEDEKKTIEPASTEEEKLPVTPEAADDTAAPELPAPEAEPLLEAPKDEETDAEAKSKEDAAKAAAIDEMEKATQKALDAMREKDNPENEKVVEDAKDDLEKIFDDFSKWMKENTQPERIKAELNTLHEKVNDILEKTRQNVIAVSQNEKFRATMESGKDFVIGTAGLIGDGLKYGYDKLLEIPEFRKAADKVGEKVEELRHSETLKNAVERSEESLKSFNEALFNGIKSFFDTAAAPAAPAKDDTDKAEPAAKEEPKEVLPDLPEDPSHPGE